MPLRWLSTSSHVTKPPPNQRMELAARSSHGSVVYGASGPAVRAVRRVRLPAWRRISRATQQPIAPTIRRGIEAPYEPRASSLGATLTVYPTVKTNALFFRSTSGLCTGVNEGKLPVYPVPANRGRPNV